jgi:hypothetical protein
MHILKLSLLLGLISPSLFAASPRTYFACDFYQFNLGRAQINGYLDQRSGWLTLSGDAILDSGYTTENVEFLRQIRVNESELKFAKYTGSTLFYFYTFSLPKNIDQQTSTNFTAYIGDIREGFGGKQDIELSCTKAMNVDLILEFVQEYRNLLTYDRLKPEHKEIVELIQSPQDLPKNIQEAIRSLRIAYSIDWEFSDNYVHGSYVINYSILPDESDAMVIIKDGEPVGYIFNITECNKEECYGWDALYLDTNGTVIYKSF